MAGYNAGHEPRILHEEFIVELERARRKFPIRKVQDNEDLLAMLTAFNEEVGELNKAIIQFLYENKGVSYTDIRMEAIQVGCMVMRVMMDTKLGAMGPHGHG